MNAISSNPNVLRLNLLTRSPNLKSVTIKKDHTPAKSMPPPKYMINNSLLEALHSNSEHSPRDVESSSSDSYRLTPDTPWTNQSIVNTIQTGILRRSAQCTCAKPGGFAMIASAIKSSSMHDRQSFHTSFFDAFQFRHF